jgi:hypothetical protein
VHGPYEDDLPDGLFEELSRLSDLLPVEPKPDVSAQDCYMWEAIAFPDSPHLKPEHVIQLVQLVHSDVVRLVGAGAAHPSPEVYFDCPHDGAAGRWGAMRFQPNGADIETVLHEVGHSLTWNGNELMALAVKSHTGQKLAFVQHHLSYVLTDEGHGPRWRSVLLALMERYAGADIRRPLALLTGDEINLTVDKVTLAYWQRLFRRAE